MKFRCERDVLVDALATAARAVSSRGGSLPVLSGVLLDLHGDSLRITGSDLELTVQYELTVDGQADGGVVVPKLISDIVKSLGAPQVDVTADAEAVEISAGRSRFSIRPLAFDDYPRVGSPAGSFRRIKVCRRVAPSMRNSCRRWVSTCLRPVSVFSIKGKKQIIAVISTVGSMPKPNSANTSDRTPTTPGSIAPGCVSSTKSASIATSIRT